MEHKQKTVTISVRKILKWVGIVFGILFIVWAIFFFINTKNNFGSSVGSDVSSSDLTTVTFDDNSNYYPNQPPNNSIRDTREFMKVSYSGSIQTREVKDTVRDVRNIIRDMKGRIDNENTQEKYASIQFVIPKSNFDDFRDEIESLTHKKLYIENTSSQNLLNQKQNIEQRTEITTQTIDELKSDLEKTTSAYTQKNASLQKQLAAAKSSLTTKQNQLASTTVTEGTPEYFKSQQTLAETFELRDKINLLNQQISAEKASFTYQKNNLTNQISGSNKDLEVIKKDDTNLNDNLETVDGSIRINWISLWELATVFSPIHPIILILLLIPLIWFIFRKFKIIPLVVFHW
jgi:hypothetical protein